MTEREKERQIETEKHRVNDDAFTIVIMRESNKWNKLYFFGVCTIRRIK